MIANYYKILSVDRNSEPDQIKKSYRKLALKYHPDVNHSPEATERFLHIQEAYEILSDASSRYYYNIIYDRHYGEVREKPESDLFYQKVRDDFHKASQTARKSAIRLSKLKFDDFKESLVQGLGKAYNAVTDFVAFIYSAVFLGSGIYGIVLSIEAIRTGGSGGLLPPWPQLILAILMALAGLAYIIIVIRKLLKAS